jgi:prepilin-type N-terminal cleavage/methylation domain-containing protein
MNLPAAYLGSKTYTSGLTLVEVLVVMSIIAFVLLFGFLVDINYYRRELSASETAVLVSTLQKVRSRAMNNIEANAHGVYLNEPDAYVLFRGNFYDSGNPQNERIPRNPNIILTSDFSEVYFEQLSGNPSVIGDIVLSDGVKTETVSLRSEGLIDW